MRLARRIPALLSVAVAVLLAVQGGATWLLVTQGQEQALADAGRSVIRALSGAEANINRGLLQVDALLSGLDVLLPSAGGGLAAEGTGTDRVLRALTDQSFLVRDILVAEPDGTILASALAASRRRPPQLSIAFSQGSAGLRAGTMVVGDPLRNPQTGEWSLYLGRMLPARANRAPALAVAEVPVTNLSQTASPTTPMPGLSILLKRMDGRRLMTSPYEAPGFARTASPSPAALPADGRWRLVPVDDASGRVIAAAVPTLYDGLLLIARLDEAQALGEWWATRNRLIAGSGAVAAFVLLLALVGAVYLRERERTAAESTRQKRTLDRALEAMNDGFVLFDAERRLVVANPRYIELFPHLGDIAVPGTPFETFAARTADILFPDGSLEERRAWIEWRIGAHERGGSFEQRFASGRIVQSTQSVTPDGGLVSVHRDVTEAKRAEARLAEAKDSAERAARMKTEFLSNMSHELRTPLNAIIGFATVLENDRSGQSEAMRGEYAQFIRTSGEHLLAVLNDVLDMSKLDAGAMTLHEVDFDLGRLLIGAVNMMSEQARAAGVHLQVDTPSDPLVVHGDERRIRQVLLNLVSNSIKFTAAGGTVRASVLRTEAGESQLIVSDTGQGVEPEHLARIFEPFYQADASPARRRGGTGLGLPISLAIMRMHQGDLRIDSTPGLGTVAVAVLPPGRCRRVHGPEPAMGGADAPRT